MLVLVLVVLVVAGRARVHPLQHVEDARQLGVLPHLGLEGVGLLVRGALLEHDAVHDHGPVDHHDLDEVEAVVAEEQHQPVLALPLVRGRLEDVEHLPRLLLAHVGVVEVAGQLPLQPVGVDVERAQVLRVLRVLGAVLPRVVAALEDLPRGDLAGLGVRVVVVLVAVHLLLVGLLELHVDAVGLVDVTLVGAADVGLGGGGIEVEVGDLLAQVGEEGEPLLGEGDAEERLRLLLLLPVALLLVLEGDEDLLDGALQHVPRLVAQRGLDEAEHDLVGLPRLGGLGLVAALHPRADVAHAERARRRPRRAAGGDVLLALGLLLGLARVAVLVGVLVLGPRADGLVAHARARHLAGQRGDLAGGLIAVPLGDEARVGLQHEIRVLLVLVLQRAGHRVRHGDGRLLLLLCLNRCRFSLTRGRPYRWRSFLSSMQLLRPAGYRKRLFFGVFLQLTRGQPSAATLEVL